MSKAVEIARDITFAEASSLCKGNPLFIMRRTDRGSGFSVWGEHPVAASAGTEASSGTSSRADQVTLAPNASAVSHEPVECYKCSGRGQTVQGTICTSCGGTGKLQYRLPEIPHSNDKRAFPSIPRTSALLSQIEMQKIMLERSATVSPLASNATWEQCHICGGDGGAGGRCPWCRGNGFEPQVAD